MSDINGLLKVASTYLHGIDLSPINKAYEFIVEQHGIQKHGSGAPYVNHLLEVAHTLASMNMDLDTITAGLLHGVLKEEKATKVQLEKLFGKDVANIVEGTTKITNVRYSSALTGQAENLRKLFLAMSSDIRVLLVKLADRLQDMLSLDGLDEKKQRQVAGETKDLFAPLASRLGIDWMKRELEDLCFQYLFPREFEDLVARMSSSTEQRTAYVADFIDTLNKKLTANNIHPVRVLGRPKHLYSIYKKLVAQNIPLERVYDKVAFRIILNSVKECYEALGTVHGKWSPVPGRIKDFISSPKSNNYQSLHTTVVGPNGHFVEIQIRTEEMDRVAQEGIAAHWAYKEGQKINRSDARLFRDLKKLVQDLQEVEDPNEFMESVRAELYSPDVFVLTPTGEVRELPWGSTPIDFAYSVHTAVGDNCAGAKVNDHLVTLKYQLKHGDIVEIITSKNQFPKRSWLQFVKTNRARTRVRQWLRREEREKDLATGREICERELKKYDASLKKLVKSGHVRLLLKQVKCNSLEDMLVKVGSGALSVDHLNQVMQPPESRDQEPEPSLPESMAVLPTEAVSLRREASGGVVIDGLGDMLVKIGQCCKPVPGDHIMGFITTGRGVSIHKGDCVNLRNTDPSRWISVSWSGTKQGFHRAELVLRSENHRRIITDISAIISGDNANIISFNSRMIGNILELTMVVEVSDVSHLQLLQQHLRQMSEIIDVRRK
ncbi:MAG: bifunctional (p)ppGpp synthetase/guanosine-3',5'-bis(diphosphate) 3'-pyrophosphohydrolase [Desulfobulbaceae bacterium]|nr:bifunctional (p)ppGpp synthetase/guanosine-3',5'-bis(diphosphate) 3'-pyrophosphohydrolase [Desulfobulbaceae bacterium]